MDILLELMISAYNPLFLLFFSAFLSWLFYLRKNEKIIRKAPFMILGFDLLYMVLLIIFMIVFAMEVAFFWMFIFCSSSLFISIFYFVFNIRRTAGFLIAKSIAHDNQEYNHNKYKLENILVLYFYFVLCLFLSINILFCIVGDLREDVLFGRQDYLLLFSTTLPIFLVGIFGSVLYAYFRKLSIRLFDMPLIFLVLASLSSIIQYILTYFFNWENEKLFLTVFGILFILVSFFINIKYLKYFKEQQLTQNQDEV